MIQRKGKKVRRMKLYADENIDHAFVEHLREIYKVNIISALEIGYVGKDDQFHFQEAKRKGRFLLTSDRDFMNYATYPFDKAKGVILLDFPKQSIGAGWLSLWLTEELVPSGGNLERTLVVVHQDSIRIHYISSEGRRTFQDLVLRPKQHQ